MPISGNTIVSSTPKSNTALHRRRGAMAVGKSNQNYYDRGPNHDRASAGSASEWYSDGQPQFKPEPLFKSMGQKRFFSNRFRDNTTYNTWTPPVHATSKCTPVWGSPTQDGSINHNGDNWGDEPYDAASKDTPVWGSDDHLQYNGNDWGAKEPFQSDLLPDATVSKGGPVWGSGNPAQYSGDDWGKEPSEPPDGTAECIPALEELTQNDTMKYNRFSWADEPIELQSTQDDRVKHSDNSWGEPPKPPHADSWGTPVSGSDDSTKYNGGSWGDESHSVTSECTSEWGSPQDDPVKYDEVNWGEPHATSDWGAPQDDSVQYNWNDTWQPPSPKSSISVNLNIATKSGPVWGTMNVHYIENTHHRRDEEFRGPPPKRCTQNRFNGKIDQDCSLWLENKCTKGDRCRYLHDLEAQRKHLFILELLSIKCKPECPQETSIVEEHIDVNYLMTLQRNKLKEEAFRQEALVTIKRLLLGSVLITCSAGLKIDKIICGFESSSITIQRLPPDATTQEIVTLLTQQGLETSQYFLREVKHVQDHKYLEAGIVTTTSIGDSIMAALDGLPFRNEILGCEKRFVGEMKLRARDMKSINLTISFKLPTRSAIAVYRTMQETDKAVEEKNNSIFNNYKISLEKSVPPKGPNGNRQYIPTSIRVFGLPLDADLKEVRRHLKCTTVKPLGIGGYDFNEFYEDLITHLTYSSKVNMKGTFLKPPEPNDIGHKQIEVKFDTWQDAKDAMDFLSKKKFKPSYPRLFFRIPHRFRFFSAVPIAQYHAQEGRWKALLDDLKESTETELFIQFKEHKVFVNLQGSDPKAVGLLKVKVEKLVKGERLAETYWHDNFGMLQGKGFLQRVSGRTGTLLTSDWRLKALKIYYNTEHSRETALELVKEEVERLLSLEWIVKLSFQMVGFFTRKGLQIAKEELGENVLSLDLLSRPARLIVKAAHAGQFTTQQMVDRLIQEARDAINENTIASSSSSSAFGTGTCPVCYDKPTLPTQLGCGHSYCLLCFRHYLASIPETKTFPLFCMGDEGNCNTPISIPTLRQYLTPLQFDRLVEIAFFTYVEKNPHKIRYCPTPDCPQVYMCCTGAKAENQFQQCPSCLMSICTSCHDEAHAGVTCAEMQLFKDPDEQERRNEAWAQENGVKRCPRCKVWIMKVDGCDHMTCHCGAHICWRCMGVFTVSDIYDHIGTAHAIDVDPF